MQTIRLYNTMSRAVEELVPVEPGRVKLYCCGPTVYDFAHIGNLRKYVCDDILVRVLEHAGYDVLHVMNVTDIDDKIINAAQGDDLEAIRRYTRPYCEAFFEDAATLHIQRPDVICHATEHIGDMVALVQRLLDRGLAYESEGSVYFRIAAFPAYGRLSHLDADGIRAGARVEVDEYSKDDVRDFALWKAHKTGEPAWETPLGRGRPGWHIECSAMAMRYLGETFDIHTGGVDNCFPHHENEIAQSEGATGKRFVSIWVHHEHLLLGDQKMAKSLGNIVKLRDLLEQGHDPRAIRYVLASQHNRTQLRFTEESLEQARSTVLGLHDFLRRLDETPLSGDEEGELAAAAEQARVRFFESLYNDLQTPQAIATMFDLVKRSNIALGQRTCSQADARRVRSVMREFDTILAVLDYDQKPKADEEIEALVRQREQARAARDWAAADAIRNCLAAMGIRVEDTPDGPRWRPV